MKCDPPSRRVGDPMAPAPHSLTQPCETQEHAEHAGQPQTGPCQAGKLAKRPQLFCPGGRKPCLFPLSSSRKVMREIVLGGAQHPTADGAKFLSWPLKRGPGQGRSCWCLEGWEVSVPSEGTRCSLGPCEDQRGASPCCWAALPLLVPLLARSTLLPSAVLTHGVWSALRSAVLGAVSPGGICRPSVVGGVSGSYPLPVSFLLEMEIRLGFLYALRKHKLR